MTSVEAACLGIPISDAADTAMKISLITYLVQWMINRRDLPPAYTEAIITIACYLNASFVHWLMEGELPIHISDVGEHHSFEAFVNALGLLLNRVCAAFHVGRWTYASPAFANQALWKLFYNLPKHGMENGFDRSKLVVKYKKLKRDIDGRGVTGAIDDQEHEFVLRVYSRLAKAFNFHDSTDNLYRCLLGLR
jgi:hypothetical protein